MTLRAKTILTTIIFLIFGVLVAGGIYHRNTIKEWFKDNFPTKQTVDQLKKENEEKDKQLADLTSQLAQTHLSKEEKYTLIENLFVKHNLTVENLSSNRDEAVVQKLQAISDYIDELKQQLDETQPTTLAAGLYETGTDNLIKSYEQLIEDGDITITNGTFKFVNTELTGDFVCGNPENITSLERAFECCSLNSVDLSQLNTNNVTNMSCMFFACSTLQSVNISNLDTSNVTNMQGMFEYCSALSNLDVSHFDTSNVTNMGDMFSGVPVTSLDLSGWDTSKVTNMDSMFDSCPFETLDLSSWNFNGTVQVHAMFASCPNLQTLILPSFANATLTNTETMFFYIPTTCTITYNGTKAEWQSIQFQTESDDYLSGITVHCSDGDLVME